MEAHQDARSDFILEGARYEKDSSVDTSSVNRIGDIDSQIFASSGPYFSSSVPQAGITMDDPFIADGLLSRQDSSWIRMPAGNESRMSQPSFTPQSCSCNNTTGPCPGHFEKMRAQVVAETTSPLSPHQHHQQQHQNHHVPNTDMSISPQLDETPLSRSGFSRSGELGPHILHIGHGSNRVRRSSQSPSTMPPINASSSSTISSPSDLLPRTASVASTADITRRFGIMLQAMRTAGFHDFDGMAAAYYTAEFEKGSFPAMVQCASRSRRLKPLLQKLQESSGQWPRWESRGLHESVLEATASLCVGEIKRLGEAKVTRLHRNEPAGHIAAFEWLLWDHGCSIQDDHTSGTSTPEDLRLPEQMEAAPDSMPCLWSILTEFAGAQDAYCDRIARVLLATLLYARSEQ